MTEAEQIARGLTEVHIKLVRDKMGPHLRNDDEARFLLVGLMLNPAVRAFQFANGADDGK